jgi:hypothetical protein
MAPTDDQQIGLPADDFLVDTVPNSGVDNDIRHVQIQPVPCICK